MLATEHAAVAPPVQGLGRGSQRVRNGRGAEDQLRQVQPVEGAEKVEVVEAAEQVSKRDEERAHGGLVGVTLAAMNASALTPHRFAQSARLHAQ
jgi:hypothetical protein